MKRLQVLLLQVLVVAELAAFLAQQRWPGFMDVFCQEDGWVENTQALLLLAASVIFLVGLKRRGWKNLWYAGYAAMFFLDFGEEISWGQRVFGIATPEKLRAENVQGELNFHNLVGVNSHVRMVGILVVIGFLFVIPWAAELAPAARRLTARFAMPVAEVWHGLVALLAVSVMLIPRISHQIVFNLDEVGELYLYLSFFCFSLAALEQSEKLPAAAWSRATPVGDVSLRPTR
jgi:hypothetical protein